jgi:SH3-like domain-containing protein
LRPSTESGKSRRRRATESLRLLAASFFALSAQSFALEFKSVDDTAVLYDSPSVNARKLHIVSRGYPLEAVVTLEHWVKVRDASGALSWIERKSLGDKRMVLVIAETVNVHQSPSAASPLAFKAARDVVLEFVEPGPPGWSKVKHRDGAIGFVQSSGVWGA